MKDIRIRTRPPRPHHEDFYWMKTMSSPKHQPDAEFIDLKHWRKYRAHVIESDFDFGIVMWGDTGKFVDVEVESSSNIYYFRDTSDHNKVRDIMETIDFKTELPGSWMGAPNFKIEDLIPLYERKKQEWKK